MSEHTRDWLCRQIVDHAGDAIIFADPDGRWTEAAQAKFQQARP